MEFGDSYNLKYISGVYLAMAFVLHGAVNCQYFKDDQNLTEEVVSIYGENFETPESREPYFITIHRCVKQCNTAQLPEATQWNEIEIVVPDINNQTKFYKYVVNDHTSCACGNTEQKLHKKLASNEVTESEFKAKLPNNPVNVRGCDPSSFCSNPRPRTSVNIRKQHAVPEQRLIRYFQCFPGCNATIIKMNLTIMTNYHLKFLMLVTNHTACAPYKTRTTQGSLPSHLKMHTKLRSDNVRTTTQTSVNTGEKVGPESETGWLIYIASPKVFLAAFVLSVVLISILIVDFNLCYRKKGLIYSVFTCRKNTKGTACPACSERQRKVIELV